MAEFRPGDRIQCTLNAEPRSAGAWHTLNRLMQMDPGVKRTLKKSQRRRRRNMVVYIRGNRDWYKREKCGDNISMKVGQSWTLPYTHQIARDLESVKGYITFGG